VRRVGCAFRCPNSSVVVCYMIMYCQKRLDLSLCETTVSYDNIQRVELTLSQLKSALCDSDLETLAPCHFRQVFIVLQRKSRCVCSFAHDDASLQTLRVALNEDFKGGETHFLLCGGGKK